jgi:hypothetical protein
MIVAKSKLRRVFWRVQAIFVQSPKKVRRTLPELLNYFDVAVEVVGRLNKLDIDQEALRALCLAWQWNKGEIKAKEVKRSHYCNTVNLFYAIKQHRHYRHMNF